MARMLPPWQTTAVGLVQHTLEGPHGSPVDVEVGLAVGIAGDGALQPRAEPGGIAGLHLGAGAAGEPADVDLAQIRLDARLEAGGRLHRRRRLAGTGEVARVEQVDPGPGQVRRQQRRLRAARVVERPVGVPLPAALGVPVGLAVAGEQDPGHGRRS
jgi:hypothetical protein